MRGYILEHETLIPKTPEPKKEIENISTHNLEVILYLLCCAILGMIIRSML